MKQELKVELKVGQRVFIESWQDWTVLQSPDDWDRQYFGDRINFRMPSGNFTNMIFAVKIEVTGRTLQWRSGENMVKGKVTWIKDGDDGYPEQSSPIWIALDYVDWEYV